MIGLERQLAHRYLGPSQTEVLRRRIEHDLHDGVQQRLVALGVRLGRARRVPDAGRPDELLHAAHLESQQVLDDLRHVAWRVYPAALDAPGLEEALATVAERSATPVTVECHDCADLPGPVATPAYFVVSESVTHAVKHAAASKIHIDARRAADGLSVQVADDGVGGADPSRGWAVRAGPAARRRRSPGRRSGRRRRSSCCRSTSRSATPWSCSPSTPTVVGYLFKDRVAHVGDFLDALGRVAAGGAAFDAEVVRQLIARTRHTDPLGQLTERERGVLELMAQGFTNAGIGAGLHLSTSAVEKHVNAIFDKLDLRDSEGTAAGVLAVLRYLGS